MNLKIGFFFLFCSAGVLVALNNGPSYNSNRKFVVNSGSVAALANSCAQNKIKPTLKDPNSFRELRHGYNKRGVSLIDVTVEYTATNGFGGRVRNNHTCTYTL